ncbi:MAG TPA: hypothetical protein VMV62_01120 [Candidatus Paceibacterota bacterium]|nr:hypothetical protein [Candidatus Paceibacterota bacterium]
MTDRSGITDTELKEAALQMYLADLDYEENKGSSLFAPTFAERCRAAQRHYREVKARAEETARPQ